MQVIRSATELSGRRVCLAIGFFDGVHLGHQQIIRQTVSDAGQHEAAPVAVTFDCHPSTVVAPDRVPPLIQTRSQRIQSIAALGVDALLLIPFNVEFSRRTGEAFIRDLCAGFGRVISVCVGASFTFGHKRSGNVDLLRILGRELKFTVHGLSALSLDGEVVSSTRVREAIQSGRMEEAGQMLGRAYSLSGRVVRGDQVGRKLGFPTANLDIAGLALPPHGVYAAHARVREKTHRAAVNIGRRPTLDNPTPAVTVEAHLLDFEGDLYGEEVELGFVQKIRDEQKFPSLDALRAQIAGDVTAARKLFD